MASNQDIEFTIKIEEPTYEVKIDNIEYNIDIETTPNYSINLAEVGPIGPQGIQGEKGDTGNGIEKIEATVTTDEYVVYTITFTNGDTYDYTVYNGSSIESINKTSTEGLVDTYTITLTDGTTYIFTVTNGEKGDKGDTGDKGETGNGISSIQLISTEGLVKTYRITYTNGNTFDYEVRDGSGTQVVWGDISGTLSEQTDLQDKFDTIDDKIKDIELFKFPNAVIVGEPTIQSGQVSGFSTSNYLQFPFLVDFQDREFEIDFSFTTSSNIRTQQNILDSNFGLAIAIDNANMVMALSSNGTSWDIGVATGAKELEMFKTYYCKLTRDTSRNEYVLAISEDGEEYTDDIYIDDTGNLFPVTMYIGGASDAAIGHTANPFDGTINMNDAKLIISGLEVWQGMDDVGLATRADVSLSNLDSVGEAKFTAKQDTLIPRDGINISEQDISVNYDSNTIGLTNMGAIKTIGVIDSNTSTAVKTWSGTKAEYDALTVKDENTYYNITDDFTETDYANVKLSNLDDDGKKVLDGQWVQSYVSLSSTYTKGTVTIDLSNYLPNDDYNYEILVNGVGLGQSSSVCHSILYSSIFPQTNNYFLWTGSGATRSCNTVIIPVGSDKTLYQYNVEAFQAIEYSLLAYRRIGTNS